MRIYCIGLGVRSGDLSVRAAKLLYGCGRIVLRTARTECSAALEGFDCVSLDGIYDTAADFDSLAEVLAERVLELAEGADFCAYCVPGSGVDDTSVAALFGKVKNRKDVEIIPAAGASASALAAYAPQLSYQSLSAYDVKPGAVNTRLPLVIYELDNPLLAGEVKLVLSELYGDGAEVYIDGKRKALNEID
ncbi:MAG: hypothetical protein LBS99_06870, partial [Clostridiales bacterium]|nr:hypothetical protein [Clostridiales bacterium]